MITRTLSGTVDTVKAFGKAAYASMPERKTTVKMLVALVALSGLAYAGYTNRAQIGAALAKGYAAAQPRLADLAARARPVMTSDAAVRAYKYTAVTLAGLTAGYYAINKVSDSVVRDILGDYT